MIKIDPGFKALIPPLKPEEFEQLEKNIVAEGCRDALVLWNGTLIDGHNRHDICTKNNIAFTTIEIELGSRDDAINWIIDNQLGRRNITREQRDYLLGLRYRQEKKPASGRDGRIFSGGQNVPPKTAQAIAEQQGVSEKTVKRAEKFADGVDKIAQARPEMKDQILQGKSDFKKQDIQYFAKIDEEKVEAEVERRLREIELEKKNRYAKAAAKIKDKPEEVQSRANEKTAEEMKVEYGEVYIIKKNNTHKLIISSCFDFDYVKRKAGQIDCVATDPPYGISYKSPTGSGYAGRGDYKVLNDDDKDFDPSVLFEYSENVITWGANHYANRLDNSAGWLVWDKREGEQINNNSDCELAWTNMISSARLFHHKWNGMIKASEHNTKRIHPTQKPIKLFEWCLEVCRVGKNVIDLFAGSGSMLLACENTDRSCTLVENDLSYAAASLKRFKENGFEVVKVDKFIQ